MRCNNKGVKTEVNLAPAWCQDLQPKEEQDTVTDVAMLQILFFPSFLQFAM